MHLQCLSILNYFRSIERTLTIIDVGLSCSDSSQFYQQTRYVQHCSLQLIILVITWQATIQMVCHNGTLFGRHHTKWYAGIYLASFASNGDGLVCHTNTSLHITISPYINNDKYIIFLHPYKCFGFLTNLEEKSATEHDVIFRLQNLRPSWKYYESLKIPIGY